MHRDPAVRIAAYLEAAKGVVVLAAASGLLSLVHTLSGRKAKAFIIGGELLLASPPLFLVDNR